MLYKFAGNTNVYEFILMHNVYEFEIFTEITPANMHLYHFPCKN